MSIRPKYSVWRLDDVLSSEHNLKKLENAFFTGKQGFSFCCNCRDLSPFFPFIVFCKKINSANEHLVFIR